MKKGIENFVYGFCSCLVLGVILLGILVFTGQVQLEGVLGGGNQSAKMDERIRSKSNRIKQFIDEYFLDDIDEQKMEDSIYKGIINGLGDEYAAYYTKEEYETITEKTSGTYCGIGAYVSADADTGAITILKPMKGSPAEEAGLKEGDIIYTVEGTEVTGKDLSQVLALIKGEEGTKVKMQIARSGEKDYLDVTLTRKMIEEDTVSGRMLTDHIGYLQVTGFEEVTPKQFDQELEKLEKKKMKGLIIDLRDNGGGLLASCVEMLDRMLPKGMVVYTEDNRGVAQEYYAKDDDQLEVPAAILVNGNSASASEVFSGAMQDEGKAKLIGTTTYGKGIVQTIFDLKDGSALKMTTAKYFTPKGRNIHGTGLKPDIQVKLDKDSLQQKDSNGNPEPDNQMEKAIEYLQEEIA